jgi:hypothetical protein
LRRLSCAPRSSAGAKPLPTCSLRVSVPATGLRLTCTSVRDRKTVTRVARPPGSQGSSTSSSTPVTNPSDAA